MNKIRINNKYSRLIFLFLITLIFSLITPRGSFLSVGNFSNVILQQVPLTLLMSLGMTLAIITGGIDKSMGAILVLSMVLSAGFIKSGNIVVGLLVAIGTGVLSGLINGLLVAYAGVFPFIATYGVENIALGVALILTDGNYVYDFPQSFRNMFNGDILGVPIVAVIAFSLFLLLYITESKTTMGKKLHASGYNFKAAHLSGINSRGIVASVYVVNGVLAAITGMMFMARLNAADPNISAQFTIDSLAATLIGGTAFGGGKGSVLHTLIGTLIVVFIQNGMNVLSVPTEWSQTVIGALILLAVFMELLERKQQKL